MTNIKKRPLLRDTQIEIRVTGLPHTIYEEVSEKPINATLRMSWSAELELRDILRAITDAIEAIE